MEHIKNFNDFLNESEFSKNSSGEVYYDNVAIRGFDPVSAVKTNGKDAAAKQVAAALVNYWEKKKELDPKFYIKDKSVLQPDKMPRKDYGFTVIVGSKDVKVEVEFRDKDIRGNATNFIFVRVFRV